VSNGVPEGNRTPDPRFRNYAEYLFKYCILVQGGFREFKAVHETSSVHVLEPESSLFREIERKRRLETVTAR